MAKRGGMVLTCGTAAGHLTSWRAASAKKGQSSMTTDQAATGSTNYELDALVNLRDLGGMPTEDGAVTASGVLYRSDAPHTGDRAPDGVGSWPPKAVVDLRDTVERGTSPHPLAGPDTSVHLIPILEDARSSEPGADGHHMDLVSLYQLMLARAADKLVEVFRVAATTDGPLLIHCAAGKDRTGVSCALLLRAAGVRRDAIVADYMHTDRNMFRVLQRLNLAPILPPGVEEEAVNELISTPADAIERVLDRLENHPGGAAAWLLDHGADETTLRNWQERILGA